MKEQTIALKLKGLWRVLPDLAKKNDDYDYWCELERELRNYLCIDMNHLEIETEDAFQDFLIEVYKYPNKFTPVSNKEENKNLKDSFFQKISLLKLAFLNKIRKASAGEVRQRILKLQKKRETSFLSESEASNLWYLQQIRRKYLGQKAPK